MVSFYNPPWFYQDKISQLESHHAGALEQLKSNVQLVENVLLEKVSCAREGDELEMMNYDN